jgi:hypothetical protein
MMVTASGCVCRKHNPCEKQHFREIPPPDFVSKCTNPAYYPVEAIVVKSLQNPAGVFRGNVVSHMEHNMIDRDDVSVENTTRSIEMMCLLKTQHDVARASARVKGRRNRPC